MKVIDWTEIYEKYRGKWVALDKDEVTVLAAGDDAKAVFEEAEKKTKAIPILHKVPEKFLPYVGGF